VSGRRDGKTKEEENAIASTGFQKEKRIAKVK